MSGETVWLVGMMGAGKSTVGKQLADLLKVEFQDTDGIVEAKARMGIDEIFEKRGEPTFRRFERDAITSVAGRKAVVALGGGALLWEGANRLRKNGRVIYLRARPETLARRWVDAAYQPNRLERMKRLLVRLAPVKRSERREQAKSRKQVERLARHRPLIKDADSTSPDQVRVWLAQLLAEREPLYMRSDLIVDTDDRSPESLAEEIAQWLQPEAPR